MTHGSPGRPPVAAAPNLTQQTWFTSAEAAAYTRFSVRTIKDAVYSGALRSDRNGGRCRHRFHRDELDRWVNDRASTVRAAS